MPQHDDGGVDAASRSNPFAIARIRFVNAVARSRASRACDPSSRISTMRAFECIYDGHVKPAAELRDAIAETAAAISTLQRLSREMASLAEESHAAALDSVEMKVRLERLRRQRIALIPR
jgi:hypothetical protein